METEVSLEALSKVRHYLKYILKSHIYLFMCKTFEMPNNKSLDKTPCSLCVVFESSTFKLAYFHYID